MGEKCAQPPRLAPFIQVKVSSSLFSYKIKGWCYFHVHFLQQRMRPSMILLSLSLYFLSLWKGICYASVSTCEFSANLLCI